MIDLYAQNRTLNVIQHSMDADMRRHDLLADNIANVNTPGFKRSDVAFSAPLQAALDEQGFKGRKTNARHFDIGRQNPEDVLARTITFENLAMRNDENNVDIDREMGELAKAQLHYRAVVKAYSGEAGKITSMIRGARSV